MKYYNIDLTQFVPYGIPLNNADHVEYKNHINEFFLRGFEKWYNQLFTTDIDDNLIITYNMEIEGLSTFNPCFKIAKKIITNQNKILKSLEEDNKNNID